MTSYLIQANESGLPDTLLLQELHTPHGCVHGIHDDMVQSTAGCANGDIILLINGSQVAKTTVNSWNGSRVSLVHESL